jgi:hypothetical protein
LYNWHVQQSALVCAVPNLASFKTRDISFNTRSNIRWELFRDLKYTHTANTTNVTKPNTTIGRFQFRMNILFLNLHISRFTNYRHLSLIDDSLKHTKCSYEHILAHSVSWVAGGDYMTTTTHIWPSSNIILAFGLLKWCITWGDSLYYCDPSMRRVSHNISSQLVSLTANADSTTYSPLFYSTNKTHLVA